MNKQTLDVIEDAVVNADHLECDGLTRIIHYALKTHEIEHTAYIGALYGGGRAVPYHFWIELPDGHIVDYRARMWLGNEAPHGVFEKNAYPNYKYIGQIIELKVDETLAKILMLN